MSIARFSPFELLLLKSRSQVDTAKLLVLAWVLVHRQHVSEGQRRRRIAQVSTQFRHGHELGPVMHIAQQQDLLAIQLAAEVIRKECSKEHSLSMMHQAITVATDNGELSLANHYILRFLADLLNVTPAMLSMLFQELTGQPLATPEDPSRDAYWRVHDADYYAQKACEAETARQQEEAQRAHTQAQEKAEREKARQQQESTQRQKQYERTRQQRGSQQGQAKTAPPPDRTTRALAVLGLTPGVSQTEVRRAYRRMAQLNHPDRFYTGSAHQIALASARFQRIKSAYDYLMQNYS